MGSWEIVLGDGKSLFRECTYLGTLVFFFFFTHRFFLPSFLTNIILHQSRSLAMLLGRGHCFLHIYQLVIILLLVSEVEMDHAFRLSDGVYLEVSTLGQSIRT